MSKIICVGEARFEPLASTIMGHPNWASICQMGVVAGMVHLQTPGPGDLTITERDHNPVADGPGDREA